MTKINKLHFNGIDYDIGDKDIHDLTAKSTLADNDEFMIADSEDGNVHKKVTKKTLNNDIKNPTVKLLMVAWGWGGWYYTDSSCCASWWWWWAGWLRYCANYNISNWWIYDIKVWYGWYENENWWDTVFSWEYVLWWWAGWCVIWKSWWSWWWSWNGSPAIWCSVKWYFDCWNNWWPASWQYAWWWWGAIGVWCSWWNTENSSKWGLWFLSDIDWNSKYYATWWSWGWPRGYQYSEWWWIWAAGTASNCIWWDGTTPWSWGGWTRNCWVDWTRAWKWADWIVIISYPTACWYKLNWWYKYTCSDNTIHCFTWDWQFWDIQQPDNFLNFLLVWWGGWWAWVCTWATRVWWWWGGWMVKECKMYAINTWTYNVVIWCWWEWYNDIACADKSDWWDSCFWDIVAKWWWGGWMWCTNSTAWYCNWRSWWNGGWAGYLWAGWIWNPWYNWWWATAACRGWGGWWAAEDWDTWDNANHSWWKWVYSIIEWDIKWYGWWWAGWTSWADANKRWKEYWWWLWMKANSAGSCDATYYWWGWGWLFYCGAMGVWWNWCQWVFIISYPSNLWYTITWWDCCYECNWNCIHIFTSDWTLTVN